MARTLLLLLAVLNATDLPAQVSATALRSARSSPPSSFPASDAVESLLGDIPSSQQAVASPSFPASTEEEEEEEEEDSDVESSDKKMPLPRTLKVVPPMLQQMVQRASEQAGPEGSKQKQAFLAWLEQAGNRNKMLLPAAVVSTRLEPPSIGMRPDTVTLSKLEAEYRALPQPSRSMYDSALSLHAADPKKGVEKVADTGAKDAPSSKGETLPDDGAEDGAEKGDTATTGNTTAPAADDTCHPACSEGQGLCSDKVCFCRSPYSGMSCENERPFSVVRFGYGIVVVIVVSSSLLGAILACNVWKLISAPLGDIETSAVEAASNTKETWRPAPSVASSNY